MLAPEPRTERLLLRPLRVGDLADLQRYAVRPSFYRYLAIAAQTPESVAAFPESRLALQRQDNRYYLFALQHLADGAVIGTIGLTLRDRARRDGLIGYGLDSDYQGQGYMTEAARRVLAFGFDEVGLHRIWATAATGNRRSWRLMQRLGMRREGRMRRDTCVRGEWRDSYLYAILAEAFEVRAPIPR